MFIQACVKFPNKASKFIAFKIKKSVNWFACSLNYSDTALFLHLASSFLIFSGDVQVRDQWHEMS